MSRAKLENFGRKGAVKAKDKASALRDIKRKKMKYDRQITIQVDVSPQSGRQYSRISHHQYKWCDVHGYDPAKYSIIFFDPRAGFDIAKSPTEVHDDQSIYTNVGGRTVSSRQLGVAEAASVEGMYANVCSDPCFVVPDFSILKELSCYSRLYLNAHGDFSSGKLSVAGRQYLHVLPEEMATIIASNVDAEKLRPDTSEDSPRRLRISVTACLGALGQTVKPEAFDDLTNSSFAAQLNHILYTRHHIDCEVVGRLASVGKTMDPKKSFPARKPTSIPAHLIESNPLAKQAASYNGKSFKELGRFKVIFCFEQGRQIMKNAYCGRLAWLDDCFDTLNQLYLEADAPTVRNGLLLLLNEISLTLDRHDVICLLRDAVAEDPRGEHRVNRLDTNVEKARIKGKTKVRAALDLLVTRLEHNHYKYYDDDNIFETVYFSGKAGDTSR